jgi:small subunit ribosomal protein S18
MADKNPRKVSKGDRPYRKPRKKICNFCVDRVDEIDYKEVEKLKKYVSDKGKILPRRVTGTCAKHQRKVTEAIQRARHIALLPYTVK